jgi:hypothetical protein
MRPAMRTKPTRTGAALAILAVVALGGCGGSSSDSATSKRLTVNVTAPADGSTVHSSRVTIRGIVEPADATVQVLGRPAQVVGGVFTVSIPLHGGDNRVDVVATAPDKSPATTAITVSRASSGSSGKKSKGSGGSGGGSSASSPPSSSGAGRSCAEGVTANTATSCPFAIRVRDAYTAQGGPQIDVYSPVTGQTYTMTCTATGTQVTCRGGNNAVVSF